MGMSNRSNQPELTPETTRPGQFDSDTAPVSVYTPAAFAGFLASKMVAAATLPPTGEIRILDPAVGDGVLLDALVRCLPETVRPRVQVFGFDANAEAIRIVASRLHRVYPEIGVHLEQQHFLTHIIETGDANNLFTGLHPEGAFHFIIAKPPHVRTRIMVDEEAQGLSEHFGLTDRVDLFCLFLLGIAEVLAEDGIAGVITDSHDLTTAAGQSVRKALLARFRVQKVWDLGDARQADAVPSVLVAKGRSGPTATHHVYDPHTMPAIPYTTLYRTDAVANVQTEDELSAFDAADETVVAIADGRRFRVRHGVVENGGNVKASWRLANVGTNG